MSAKMVVKLYVEYPGSSRTDDSDELEVDPSDYAGKSAREITNAMEEEARDNFFNYCGFNYDHDDVQALIAAAHKGDET